MKKDIYEVPAHRYGFAGLMNNIAGNPDENGKLTSGPFAGMSGSVAGGLGALGTAVGGMVGTAIAGGRESTAGNVIDGLSNVASAIPGPWGAVAGAGLKVIGGLTNAAFGVKLNQENINNVNNNIASMNGFQSNAGSFDSLTENFNSQPTMMSFNQDYIGKNGWFNKGATKKFNQLQAQQQTAQQFVNNSLTNNLNNLVMGQNQSLLANYAAKGGPLMTQGTEWNTGLNYIGEGGSHEQNPNGGIQQGIAPDGLPNLVEEGEVVWNGDYVFSKRLKVNKSFKKKYKLGREDKPLSYADAALIFNKEMEERPNDVISKRGRDANLARLAESQEEKRAKIAAKEQAQQDALMGMMGMPQDQMAMQEPMMPEEQPVDEMSQGMPIGEGYAAKGGPIGHKYLNAGELAKIAYSYFGYPEDYFDGRFGTVPVPYQTATGQPLFGGYKGRLKDTYDGYGTQELKLPYGWRFTPDTTEYKYYDKDGANLTKDAMNWFTQVQRRRRSNNFVFNEGRKSNKPLYDELNAIYDKFAKYGDTPEALIARANNGGPGDVSKAINALYDKYGKELNTSGIPDTVPIEASPLNDIYYGSTLPKELLQVPLGPAGLPKIQYSANQTVKNINDIKGNTNGRVNDPIKYNYPWEGHLKYMPAIGSGLAFFGDLLNLTNRPDYSAADAISRSTRGLRDVRFTPLGDYAKYTPVDRMLALNQLGAAAGANRRALMNQTAGNRGTAMAGLLAADNNFMNNIGTTLFTADNANYDRYMKALAHNTDINKSNSTGFLQADMANQRMDEVRARYNTLAADARMKALQLASANRSANYNNFFDNLGNIGIDALNRADARWLSQYWPGANSPSSGYRYAKCGGKLNKRRRRTII